MQRYMLHGDCTSLDVLVPEGTDFDGDFTAHDTATGEPLLIHGWLIAEIEQVAA